MLFDRIWHHPLSCACITDNYGPITEKTGIRLVRSLVSLFVSSAVFRPPLACIPFYRRHPKDVFRLFELSHEASHRIADELTRLFTDPDWVLSHSTAFVTESRTSIGSTS